VGLVDMLERRGGNGKMLRLITILGPSSALY